MTCYLYSHCMLEHTTISITLYECTRLLNRQCSSTEVLEFSVQDLNQEPFDCWCRASTRKLPPKLQTALYFQQPCHF